MWPSIWALLIGLQQSASGLKTEITMPRETLAPPAAELARPRITLPDEVVVRAIDLGRPAFARCFKRAMDNDAYDAPFKVTLHIEVDDTGKITGGTTNAPTPALGNCLLRVGFGLSFGTPGSSAVVDVPLFFRG